MCAYVCVRACVRVCVRACVCVCVCVRVLTTGRSTIPTRPLLFSCHEMAKGNINPRGLCLKNPFFFNLRYLVYANIIAFLVNNKKSRLFYL